MDQCKRNIQLHELPKNQDGTRSLSIADRDEELIVSGPPQSNYAISFRPQRAIPLPDIGQTPIDWDFVDRVSRLLFPRISFITGLILAATTGSIQYGFNTALLNTSVSYIASNFGWCSLQGDVECGRANLLKSLISTSLFLGATGGAITAGRFTDNGPRLLVLASAVVFFVGIVSCTLSNHFSSLFWARLIVGFGVGIISVVTPTYISEMSPPARRGAFGVVHQVVLAIGQLLANVLGLAFTNLPRRQSGKITPDQMSYALPLFNKVWWRIMLSLGLIPVIVALLLFGPLYVFETPQYYASKNDYKTSALLLQRIYNKTDVEVEVQSLKNQASDRSSLGDNHTRSVSFRELMRKPGYTYAFLVGLGISLLQQLTGISAFIASSNKLFADAGLKGRNITFASTALTLINVISCCIPIFLIERLGRRTLLLIGGYGMVLSIAPATIQHFIEWNATELSGVLTGLSIAGACLFVIFFGIGAGSITWIYVFEIFPLEIKATAASICVALNWVTSIIIVFCAAYLEAKINYLVFTSESLDETT